MKKVILATHLVGVLFATRVSAGNERIRKCDEVQTKDFSEAIRFGVHYGAELREKLKAAFQRCSLGGYNKLKFECSSGHPRVCEHAPGWMGFSTIHICRDFLNRLARMTNEAERRACAFVFVSGTFTCSEFRFWDTKKHWESRKKFDEMVFDFFKSRHKGIKIPVTACGFRYSVY